METSKQRRLNTAPGLFEDVCGKVSRKTVKTYGMQIVQLMLLLFLCLLVPIQNLVKVWNRLHDPACAWARNLEKRNLENRLVRWLTPVSFPAIFYVSLRVEYFLSGTKCCHNNSPTC